MQQQPNRTGQKLISFLNKTGQTSERNWSNQIINAEKKEELSLRKLDEEEPYEELQNVKKEYEGRGGHLIVVSGRMKQKISSQHLYRSMDADADDQKNRPYHQIQDLMINMNNGKHISKEDLYLRSRNKMHRQVLSSLDGGQRVERNSIVSRGKLYQIPINSNKLKQKCDKNMVSLLKIPINQKNKEKDSGNNISMNFNTYYQLQQYMSKVSGDLNQTELKEMTAYQNNKGYINKKYLKSQKKCSIIPALRPPVKYKQKKNVAGNQIQFDNLHQYLSAQKARLQLQKSLIVQSKKQELVSNIVSRYKVINKKYGHNKTKNQFYIKNKSLIDEQVIVIKDGEIEEQEEDDYNSSKKSQCKNNSKTIKNNKNMAFLFNNNLDKGVYQQKIRSYRDFIFKINFAHRIFDPLIMIESTLLTKTQKSSISRYKYYIGPGNNSMLVRSLMKRRVWWDQVKNPEEAQFIWTQLKINSIYQSQIKDSIQKFDKLDKNCKGEVYNQDKNSSKLMKRKQIKNATDCISCEKITSIKNSNNSFYQSKSNIYAEVTQGAIPRGLMFKAPFAVKNDKKIFTQMDDQYYKEMMKCIGSNQNDNFQSRLKGLSKDFLLMNDQDTQKYVHNHFQYNHSLGNKKALFYHMRLFYLLTQRPIDQAFPLTFHIRQGQNDPQFKLFFNEFKRIQKQQPKLKNIWILKPGENSNRGTGITVVRDLKMLRKLMRKQKHHNGEAKTYILQKYIEKPLLYKGRKFDIRHYMLITGLHGRLRAYWYGQGYVRTSSFSFTLQEIADPLVHLTNDAIQKQSEDYGCYEDGNKVSYNELQKYFIKNLPQKKFDFADIYSKMRDLGKDAVCAAYRSIDPNHRMHNFQVFGLDFMIDDNLKVMLIEVNTNPCLELSSQLLSRVIPSMLQQSLRIGLDPIFPPLIHYSNNTRYLAPDCSIDKLQYELIFDQARDGKMLKELYDNNVDKYNQMMNQLSGSENEVDDVFEDEGQQLQMDKLIG